MRKRESSFWDDVQTLFMLYLMFVLVKWVFWDTPKAIYFWLFYPGESGLSGIVWLILFGLDFAASAPIGMLVGVPAFNAFGSKAAWVMPVVTIIFMVLWPIFVIVFLDKMINKAIERGERRDAEQKEAVKEKHRVEAKELNALYERKLEEVLDYAKGYEWYNKNAASREWLIERIVACSNLYKTDCGAKVSHEVMYWSIQDEIRKSLFMFKVFRGRSFSDTNDELILQCDCLFSFVDGKTNPILSEHLKAKRALERANRKAKVAKK